MCGATILLSSIFRSYYSVVGTDYFMGLGRQATVLHSDDRKDHHYEKFGMPLLWRGSMWWWCLRNLDSLRALRLIYSSSNPKAMHATKVIFQFAHSQSDESPLLSTCMALFVIKILLVSAIATSTGPWVQGGQCPEVNHTQKFLHFACYQKTVIYFSNTMWSVGNADILLRFEVGL